MVDNLKNDITAAVMSPRLVGPTELPPEANLIATGLQSEATIDIVKGTNKTVQSNNSRNQQNQVCITATSPQNILDMGQKDPIQCAWYYDRSTLLGSGYLSTKDGPIVGLAIPPPDPGMRRYFGTQALRKAQEDMDNDYCTIMTDCKQASDDRFKGVCGYCMATNKGVPVDSTGAAKYPSNMCSTGKIVISAEDPVCKPAKTAKYNPYSSGNNGVVSPAPTDILCQPDKNKRLSGECLRSVLRSGGCSANGAVFKALQNYTPTTNMDSIPKNYPTIGVYMEQKNSPFNLQQFVRATTKDDATTQALALSKSSSAALNATNTNSKNNTLANALAIDLCQTSGYFVDQYDFCSELTPTSEQPREGWRLDCLQKAFLNAGLTEDGKMYPLTKDSQAYVFFNSLNPWSKVLDYMKTTFANLNVVEKFANLPTEQSSPFVLRLTNYEPGKLDFRDRCVQFNGSFFSKGTQWANIKETQVIAKKFTDIRNETDPLFTYARSRVAKGAIQIYPRSQPDNVLRHSSYILFSFVQNPNDNHLQWESSFYVRPANSGEADAISFESAIYPGRFLRHSGFKLFLHPMEGNPTYKYDSSFKPQASASMFLTTPSLGLGFFKVKEIVDQAVVNQNNAMMDAVGTKLDPALVSYQFPGAQGFANSNEGIEVFASQPIHNIHTITHYSIMPNLLSVNVTGASQVYTLTNYVIPQSQMVTPTFKMGVGNTVTGAVNGYITEGVPVPAIAIDTPAISATTRYTVETGRKNIVKTLWKNNGGIGPQYEYKITGSAKPTVLRKGSEPFLKFEPFSDPNWTGNKYIFTEVRMPEIANVQIQGALRFQTTGTSLLKCPGTHGYAQLTASQINIPYIDFTLAKRATFCFSIANIPPSTAAHAVTLLRLCNRTETSMVNGYTCAAYGSTNSTISFAVQTPGKSTDPVSLTLDNWYILELEPGTIRLYSVNPKPTLVSTIILSSIRPIQKSNPQIGPFIQIGDALTALRLNVAWLHLY